MHPCTLQEHPASCQAPEGAEFLCQLARAWVITMDAGGTSLRAPGFCVHCKQLGVAQPANQGVVAMSAATAAWRPVAQGGLHARPPSGHGKQPGGPAPRQVSARRALRPPGRPRVPRHLQARLPHMPRTWLEQGHTFTRSADHPAPAAAAPACRLGSGTAGRRWPVPPCSLLAPLQPLLPLPKRLGSIQLPAMLAGLAAPSDGESGSHSC